MAVMMSTYTVCVYMTHMVLLYELPIVSHALDSILNFH